MINKYCCIILGIVGAAVALSTTAAAFQPLTLSNTLKTRSSVFLSKSSTTATEPSWFSTTAAASTECPSLPQLKAQILQLGAALDRGQSYNPTSGSYYAGTMDVAKQKIQQLLDEYEKPARSLQDMEGEWELVLTTVAHGIFRSSPFFLAIQEAYERFSEEKGNPVFQVGLKF